MHDQSKTRHRNHTLTARSDCWAASLSICESVHESPPDSVAESQRICLVLETNYEPLLLPHRTRFFQTEAARTGKIWSTAASAQILAVVLADLACQLISVPDFCRYRVMSCSFSIVLKFLELPLVTHHLALNPSAGSLLHLIQSPSWKPTLNNERCLCYAERPPDDFWRRSCNMSTPRPFLL